MSSSTIATSSFELRNPSNALVTATVSYDSQARVATLTPASALAVSTTYTATIKGGTTDPRVKDAAGNALAANFTWSFTTAAAQPPPPSCPCTIWSPSTVPSVVDDGDSAAVEVGTKFRSDVAGNVTGARFYKSAANTGTHVAHLWTSTGTLLATATFTGETASGWQQVAFPSPVAINANTTYVISYLAPNGHYSAPDDYFLSAGVDNAPLHALRDGVDGANGVYSYTTTGAFPNQTYRSESYFVDVVFNSSAPTFGISGTITPLPGGSAVTVTLSGAATATTTTNASGTYSFSGLANGNYSVTPSKSGFTFTPASQTVAIAGANSTVNFTAEAIPTYGISGTISPIAGGSGATVTLSGAAAGTTTADSSGHFSFTGLANGNYTVTPSKTGFTFTPPSQPVTISNADGTATFTAQPVPTYSIAGTIAPVAIGSGATVALSGAAVGTATADSSGNYAFTGLLNGNYTVTPTKSGFSFTPPNRAVIINGAGATADFTAFAGINIDATVTFGRSNASSSITSPAFSTTSGNELFLAFVASDRASGTASVSSVTGAGLTWQLVRRTNTQRGTSEIWRAFSTTTRTNVTVTATLNQSVAAAITVMTFTGVDTSGTNGSGAVGASGSGNAGSGAPTASLVTTRANSLVVGVGNDWDNDIARTPGANQILVSQYLATVGDTFWVQRTSSVIPAAGTSVTINDTAPTADRYNLTICEILVSP